MFEFSNNEKNIVTSIHYEGSEEHYKFTENMVGEHYIYIACAKHTVSEDEL